MNSGTISVAEILRRGDAAVSKDRFQDPTIQKTAKGQPYIRPYVDVIKNGKLKRVKQRFYLASSGETPGQAEQKRRKKAIMDTINRTEYVVKSQIPFKAFVEHYIKNHVDAPDNLSASTRGKYHTHLKNHILPAFEDLALCDLDTLRIQTWLSSKSNLSWATRTDLRNILSSIFTKAIAWGQWKDKNPVEGVSAGKARPVRERVKLTDEQTRALLAALRPDVREIVCAALFLGLRISEILAVQWKHLDLTAGTLTVSQRYYRGDLDVTKSSKPRTLQLGYLAEDLKLRKSAPDEYVFKVLTHAGTARENYSRDDRDINQHFLRPVAKTLGVYTKGFGFHSFRREAITAMMREDVGQAMRFAGHSKVDMSLAYTLVDSVQQDRVIRARQEELLGKSPATIQ